MAERREPTEDHAMNDEPQGTPPPPPEDYPEPTPRPEEYRTPPSYPPVLKPISEPRKRSRNPIDRLTHRLPRPWRIAIDWIVTIAGAVAIVLAIKQWIVNPYRIPSSSMEPTLHCARPGSGCESSTSDRVLACRICYTLHSPHRRDIAVFRTPTLARTKCGAGGTF